MFICFPAGIIEKQINVQGAIEYVAPEVLEWEKKGQESPCFDGGKADFWSLGIMAFEMSTGKIPKGKKFDILTSEDTTHFDTEFRSLLTGLLQFDSAKRLGYQELVRHTYFISIDWDQLSTSCPPYIPEFDSDLDLSHFEPDRNPAPLERTSLRKSPNKKRSPQNPEYIIGKKVLPSA